MNIYWSTKLVPELAGLSGSQRKKVLRECNYAKGTFFVVVFLATFLSSFLGSLLRRFNLDPGFGGIAFFGGLYFGLIGLLAGSIRLVQLRSRIRQYLQHHADELKTI